MTQDRGGVHAGWTFPPDERCAQGARVHHPTLTEDEP
jgi:hypothetical protein